MPYPCKLHEQAHKEYIDAYEWYELKEKGLGNKFMDYVEKRLHQISEHPEYYGKLQENYREVKVENFPYKIVYELLKHKQLIHIVSIYHDKRNPVHKYRKMK